MSKHKMFCIVVNKGLKIQNNAFSISRYTVLYFINKLLQLQV